MIERKKKKCKKGTSKALGFEGCGELKYMHKYSLCKDCFVTWTFSTPEGMENMKSARITGKKRSDKEIKKEERERKENNKSIAQLKQEARRPFQKLIRIRDHGKNCVCCHRPLPFDIGSFDAGHFLKAEVYSGLIFHPDNVHGQTVYCNKYSDGNELGYLGGILNRIGEERVDNLQSIKNKLKDYEWSREELNNIKKHYNKELRLVEKGKKNINDVDFTIGIINL
jgi:hypothetical protein